MKLFRFRVEPDDEWPNHVTVILERRCDCCGNWEQAGEFMDHPIQDDVVCGVDELLPGIYQVRDLTRHYVWSSFAHIPELVDLAKATGAL